MCLSQLWIRFFPFSNENPRLVAWLLGWLNPGASHARMDGYTPSLLGTNTVQQIIGAGRGHRHYGWYIGILNQRKDYWSMTSNSCNFWGVVVIFGMHSSPCKAVYHRYLGDAPTSVRARWVDPGFYPVDAQIFGEGWKGGCQFLLVANLRGAATWAALEWSTGRGMRQFFVVRFLNPQDMRNSSWPAIYFEKQKEFRGLFSRSRCLCWRYRSDYSDFGILWLCQAAQARGSPEALTSAAVEVMVWLAMFSWSTSHNGEASWGTLLMDEFSHQKRVWQVLQQCSRVLGENCEKYADLLERQVKAIHRAMDFSPTLLPAPFTWS